MTRRPSAHAAIISRIAALANDGWTMREIADRIGVTRDTIKGIVTREGISLQRGQPRARRESPPPKTVQDNRPFHPPKGPDHFRLDLAHVLKERIRQYWADQGHAIEIWVEPTSNGRNSLGHIRSDMVGGLPRTSSLAGDHRARPHSHLPHRGLNDRSTGDADPCTKGAGKCPTR